MLEREEYPPAYGIEQGYAGGWMNPKRDPKLAGAVLFEPFNNGRGIEKTASEKRAFHKRVAKRRAKKGYR